MIGAPMLKAALEAKNTEVALVALAMGASVSPSQLALLDELGADLATPVETRTGRCTLASVMARTGCVDALGYLINRGAELGAKDGKGNTALHLAAAGGNPEIVALLIGHGAPVNATAFDRFTPLHTAALCGHLEVCTL